ncbi:gluconate 2-dehydrogenase gamma chain [Humitalea rosea]|uniref:Gluconate 2-dehydrogenase gamma chain n=1 Tax=Humitalea rosea TaxID=990373 RepID=A0A2W7IEM9_9PROT|nr:gluconate 2-dehydrogenase subunit 3 family protein [Humitalea rosea]PZW44919.1 gluconate 2-dehydrogenase gamma chain [Humitalea rosea]
MPKDPALARRNFLKGAAVGGTAAATLGGAALTTPAVAQPAPAPAAPAAAAPAAAAMPAPGYMFLKPEEVAFVEAMVDTMIPADAFTPKGTDMGLATFIDRALADGWGKGDRLYLQGPWKQGTPNQGYQLSLTPAALWRAGIEATNAHCVKAHGQPLDQLTEAQRNQVLLDLDGGRITFEDGLPARTFWSMAYGNVMEGMFADPIYGGNRDKAGWRLVGFPGVIQNNRNNVVTWRNRKYDVEPVSISDMS